MEENKDIIVDTDEIQANSSNPEPLARSVYTMKAFQSSYQPATLAWDSVGDKANYNTNGAVTSEKWVRQGIYICSSDQFGGPGFFITDYDGFYDLPTYGNMFFKAVMCRLDLKVMVPPYSNFTAVVDVQRTVFKEGDDGSSTWLGMASGEWDACKTISEDNCGANGEWAGVPIESGFYSYRGKARHIDETCQCVNKTWSIDNRYSENAVRTSMIPKYLMNMLERPEKYNTRMGYVDKYHISKEEFSLHFTAYVWYGDDFDAGNYYENKATRLVLKTSERTGYIMLGWLDADINVLYPAGGAYRQRRGAKLQEQWVEDVVPYRVIHHYEKEEGIYTKKLETRYYMADGIVCPQPDQDIAYVTPEPITAKVAADGSTVIEYYYDIKYYDVLFLANGGFFSGGSPMLKETLPYGMLILKPKHTPHRYGYIFKEWIPSPDGVVQGETFVTSAKWTANKYTVEYDKNDDNATGEMEPQEFVYDQPQQLSKNTYECNHTIKYEVVTPKGDTIRFEQTVKCGFVGWKSEEYDAKVYNDEEMVCNLTSVVNDIVYFKALWEPASIQLPKFDYEGYYLDAWYESDQYEGTPIKPGSEYKPKEGVTLYGKLICTKVENAEWDIRSAEYVYERPIWATWKAVEGAKAYRVGLESEAKRVNYPLYEEDFTGEGVTYINAGAVEVIGTKLDFTKALARFTAGGTFNFSVTPVFENIPEGSIGGTVSNTVTTLARPENPKWKDGNVATWDSVKGADYYLVWIYCNGQLFYENTQEKLDDVCEIITYRNSGSCVQSNEPEIDLSEVVELGYGEIQFSVLGYSNDTEECYTPQYEKIISSIWNA